ncbi:SYF2-domain-containing protein [Cristinia sonorae]|uniref:Pre-mRNA-splicing factor SYF2 n=1 Tax=Cristinia sonorae TaxID=1940300 RepID=A0A8K0UMS1_9AGAR|nr:SYF2-domain-containing protein [Cristinia sonorae]
MSDNEQSTVSKVSKSAEEFVDKMSGVEALEADEANGSTQAEGKMTMEQRKAKMDELRKRMRTSTQANRASVIEETTKSKVNARETARLERARKLAEVLRQKADAEERGEDVERSKNWEYTIEENEEWEKKLARKARRADFEFHDLASYNKQKELALCLAPGSLAKAGSFSSITSFNPNGPSSSQLVPTTQQQQLAAEALYRDANTLLYADNKPTEDAIDKVVEKMNKDRYSSIDKKKKFSRKRQNEEEGDITYINERNRVFNKKIARYYDKYYRRN